MSFQQPVTIASIIDDIENHRCLLPAIQREFVWSHKKIEWLFDSIMRNYPIGSFLFWYVEGDTKNQYKYYEFINEYRQRYKTHNEEFNTSGSNDFNAILDGQQRFTSLYIGLKGSYAYKRQRVWWENTEKNIPTRHLYLNILEKLENEEDGRIYQFKFLTEYEYNNNYQKWFRVGKILELNNIYDFTRYLDTKGYKENEFTYQTLSILQQRMHGDKIINFFLEKEQDIDKALNIFIRMNSGGEPLNFSDLLMSIAVANWKEKDAKKEIYRLVDEIRDKGFPISKDFILRVFLVLYSNDIKFRVTNFSADNANEFEIKWQEIRDAISSVFDLVKSFGFNESTLTSNNALIPIIYYLYHRNIYRDFHKKVEYQDDRKQIKKWLHIVLIKRTFGGQADAILTKIRNVFTDNFSNIAINDAITQFPVNEIADILHGTIRDLKFDNEYIEKLLLTQKDENYAFSILALLYPHLDYRNGDFHKDHLHPISNFNTKYLCDEKINDDYVQFYLNPTNHNSILNLQMLDANENMSKQNKDLKEWVEDEILKHAVTKENYCNQHLIPTTKLEFNQFPEFIEERTKILTEKFYNILDK